MSVIEQVRRTLQRHQLATGSTRVVAALSGGPDSMALIHILHELDRIGELRLVAAAHLNHGLRAEASDDERFCEEVARSLSLPFAVDRALVRELAAREHRSIEDAAHHARQAFFERAAAMHAADVVAVGHTRDDQAETFLLRLLRGAGTRGLAAMYPRHGVVVRPLLDCSRTELRDFLRQRAIAFVHDTSNDDLSIPRNRLRAEVLPLLTARFNPRLVEGLAAEAELARLDQTFFDELTERWVDEHVQQTGERTWSLDRDLLASLPPARGWRVLHTVMRQAADGRPVSGLHVRKAWSAVVDGHGRFDAPGHRLQRVGQSVVLMGRPAGSVGRPPAVAASQVRAFCHPLPVPGEVMIPEIGCVLSAEVASSVRSVSRPNGVTVLVPKERVADGLAVRNRRAGDRLRPSRAGSRKVQDLLVDHKVARAERDRIPIVVDTAGRIVWVAGHALDRDFQVSDPAQAVVVLRLKGVGGSS